MIVPPSIRLQLVNSDSDQDLGYLLLEESYTVNLNQLPLFSIKADDSQSPTRVKSVYYYVNDEFYHRTNRPPFLIAGDSGSDTTGRVDYTPWIIEEGMYAITAIPYSQPRGKGIEGEPVRVTLTVTRSTGNRIQLVLVNADSNQDIRVLGTSGTHTITRNGSAITLRAEPIEGTVASVYFYANGNLVMIDNRAPFTIAGGRRQNMFPWKIVDGTHEIRVEPYTKRRGRGSMGDEVTISLTIQ